MSSSRRVATAALGLVALVACACAGAAPAARSLDPSAAPQLRVQSADLLDPADITVATGQEPVARVMLLVPKGYVLGARLPAGADVGFAAGIGSGPPGEASLVGGTLTTADPVAAAADPAAQACDPGPHLAVLAATLVDDTADATAELTVFVDAGAHSTAAYLLEYCPPLLAGQHLSSVELSLDGRVLATPKRPAVYTWSALVTPPAGETAELRAEVPVPATLTLEARYEPATHLAVLTGRDTQVGRPRRGAQVVFHAAGARAAADFGPVRTDAQGRFSYRWAINEPTAFTAHVASMPPRPCSGASAAPGGCLSTTTSGPLDASVQVIPRAATAPRLVARAADARLAARIGLRRGDLPAGWQPLAAGTGPTRSCDGFRPKESDLTETAAHTIAFASRPSSSFAAVAASETIVLATRRQAAAYFAREARPGRIACFADEARSSGAAATESRLPVARLGRAAAGFRIRAVEQDGTFYFDEIGILGARSVTFLLLTWEEAPPPLESRLARTIAARAQGG